MNQKLHKISLKMLLILLLPFNALFAQTNIPYWKESFTIAGYGGTCDLTTVSPTAITTGYFNGNNSGVWWGKNIYNTTGTGCPAGNPHIRFKNIAGVTDSGQIVTPIVDFGIKELHFYRARASRSYNIWITNDTLATTTNWTPLMVVPSSAATITCADTTIMINSATARRLKIVARPGTDTDIDSIWLTNFTPISTTPPTVATKSTLSITSSSAFLGVIVSNEGSSSVSQRGVIYGTSINPTFANTKISLGTGLGNVNTNVTGLTPGTLYHVRGFAINSTDTAFGADSSFTTLAAAPTVITNGVGLITSNSALLKGNVTSSGGASVTERGIVYSTTANPIIGSGTKVAIGFNVGTYGNNVTGLNSATLYHFRAYAINSVGTSYGADSTFTTLTSASTAPTVSTTNATLITATSATLAGNVSDSGTATVTERGVVYATTVNPTTANTKVQIGSGIGVFSQNITGLSANTKYYVRAYAINGAGTGYGSMDSFTTTTTSVPTITIVGTLGVFKACVGSESALDSFIVSGSNLTAGIAINAPSGFEISSIPALGFSANFSLGQSQGTSPSTIVYVRLKSNATGAPFGVITLTSTGAANKNLVAAGNVIGKPTITLSSISNVLTTDTSFNLNYTSAPGNPNQYSIVTGTPNAMPSFVAVNNAAISSSPIKVTIPASAANVYNFNLTVKNSNTGCISSVIGVNLNVIPAIAPIVLTTSATLIGITNATLGGNVSDSGTASVSERGVVYATSANPTTADTKVIIGSGLGNFSQNVTSLLSSTTYHVRAYAINSASTSYGADSTFTTLPASTVANVITGNVTNISNTSASLAGNVVTDGGATVTERGIVLATTANPTTANSKITIGNGLGDFSQNITALTPNTVYHYRAYAINNVGTGYGIDSVFTTLPNPGFNKNITNAFSPDGNGTNDTWVIDNVDMLDGHEITIYNIFGQVIFSQTGYNTPWDGKKDGNLVPSGEYYYQIKGSKVNIKGALLIKTHQ